MVKNLHKGNYGLIVHHLFMNYYLDGLMQDYQREELWIYSKKDERPFQRRKHGESNIT